MSRTRGNSTNIGIVISPEPLNPQKEAAPPQPRKPLIGGASRYFSSCVVPKYLCGPWWLHKHRDPLQVLNIFLRTIPQNHSLSPSVPSSVVSPCSRGISPTMSYYQGQYDGRSSHSEAYQGRQGQHSQQPAGQRPPQINCE